MWAWAPWNWIPCYATESLIALLSWIQLQASQNPLGKLASTYPYSSKPLSRATCSSYTTLLFILPIHQPYLWSLCTNYCNKFHNSNLFSNTNLNNTTYVMLVMGFSSMYSFLRKWVSPRVCGAVVNKLLERLIVSRYFGECRRESGKLLSDVLDKSRN